MASVTRVFGIDFSGAAEPGERIWITGGRLTDTLELTATGSAEEFLSRVADVRVQSGRREAILSAIVEWIARADQHAYFGFDFPFSLPSELVPESEWSDRLATYPHQFSGPEGLRQALSARSRMRNDGAGTQRLRATEDRANWTARCAYNLQITRQTYHGVTDVLRPLVRTRRIRVPPFGVGNTEQPTVAETYPAGIRADLRDELGLDSEVSDGRIIKVLDDPRVKFGRDLDFGSIHAAGSHARVSLFATIATARLARIDGPTEQARDRIAAECPDRMQRAIEFEGHIYT